MATNIYNLSIDQGATFAKQFRWQDSGSSVYPDLTALSGRMDIKHASSLSGVINLTSTGAATTSGITLGTGGYITIQIPASGTDTLKQGKYVYDLEIISGLEVTRFAEGFISVSSNITR